MKKKTFPQFIAADSEASLTTAVLMLFVLIGIAAAQTHFWGGMIWITVYTFVALFILWGRYKTWKKLYK